MTTDHSSSSALFNHRSLKGVLPVVTALAVLLAACGDKSNAPADTAPAPTSPDTTAPDTTTPDTTTPDTSTPDTVAARVIGYPHDAEEAVIWLDYGGGYVLPDEAFREMPSLVVAGDGKVYEQGATSEHFPGPLVRPMTVRTITEDGIEQLLASADEAGLLAEPPDYAGGDSVTDMPYTVLSIEAAGSEFDHSAYALGWDGEKESPARQTLAKFIERLSDLETLVGSDQLGEATIFAPTSYRLRAFDFDDEELSYLDTELEPTISDWPDSAGVSLARADDCAAVTVDAIGSLFADATENTLFREGSGSTARLYRLAVVPVLLGKGGC